MIGGVSDAALPPTLAPLILLGGASGSGKSHLAELYGRPALSLDDYYREQAEDAVSPLPRTPYGEIDWDHPGTWNGEAAVAGVMELLATGRTTVPRYSIEHSAADGTHEVTLGTGPVAAEGIFGAEALQALRAAGCEVDAFYIDSPRWFTALRRFARDVAERRKPLPFLLKRGVSLFLAEPAFRRRHLEAGFVPVSKRALKRALAAAASGPAGRSKLDGAGRSHS